MVRTWFTVGVAGIVCFTLSVIARPARSADLYTKAPVQPQLTQCAVDGFNGNVGGLGGSSANHTFYGGFGSLSVPLGCSFGAQFDGNASNLDSRFLGSIGGHLFWRDPSKGLIGLYGSYTNWAKFGGVHAGRIGGEGEWYYGNWTLSGVAGVEFGNSVSGNIGSDIVTYDVPTRFFDEVNLAYYLKENFDVYVGHRYMYGKNALALGGEYGIPLTHSMMASLFVEGRIGKSNDRGIWGGLKFYFGQKEKTLLRRHREDDPPNWGVNDDGDASGGSTSSAPSCPYRWSDGSCHNFPQFG